TAFSIERLFDQLASIFQERGHQVDKIELPLYNNQLGNVWKNLKWARSQVRAKNKKQRQSVHHVTGDVNSIVFGLPRPSVITIHDCNPLLRYAPSHPRHWFYRWIIFELPARRAKAVTVISEKTRTELLEMTNCPADKLHVIPNFVDPAFVHHPQEFNQAYPTILQIGVKENKNISRLAKALHGIPCKLSIVGKPSDHDLNTLKEQAIDFEWAAGISDEALRNKYRDCDLLAFTSTYEGFGLPILEAQMTGRPVLTSDLSPHREVAGPNGAELADPFSVEQIRNGILNIINNPTHRQNLVTAGHNNAARYHIEAVATRYLNLYASLA
ncbi:MAG: glycosyltransferase family 1 protein, partial [Bacteroidota bacterium]